MSSCAPSRRSTSFWGWWRKRRAPSSAAGRTRSATSGSSSATADFEDLVTGVHLVAGELSAHGFGEQLLAALFAFEGGDRDGPVYLIYGFKRGAFWPFVPTGEDHERDNAEELRLRNELQGELPIEPELTRWLGLFDAPLD